MNIDLSGLTPFETEPDYETPEAKWWVDKNSTQYAKDLGVVVYFVELVNGDQTRLIVNISDNAVLHDNTSMEGIGVFIDMLRADKDLK